MKRSRRPEEAAKGESRARRWTSLTLSPGRSRLTERRYWINWRGTFRRYIALPAHGAETLALWAVFSHALDCFEVAPRLALVSPEKRCGKTLTLMVLQRLVPRPLLASNVSPAALFRTVEKARPTLLLDEAETYIHAGDEIQGLLNSGHTRSGAFVVRVCGDDYEPRKFRTWAAMAFGAIGRLPDTLSDRSIIVPMRRKRPEDVVEPFRQDRVGGLHGLCRKAARWAKDHADALRVADPDTPGGLNDRAASNRATRLWMARNCSDVRRCPTDGDTKSPVQEALWTRVVREDSREPSEANSPPVPQDAQLGALASRPRRRAALPKKNSSISPSVHPMSSRVCRHQAMSRA